ncbi:unnamed protein product [Adineta steineri]|nr:unnamed protein product [Adineta steineri]
MSITALTISYCACYQLLGIFQYALTLKYLKIEHLANYAYGNGPSKLSTGNAVRLNQLIINDCKADFEMIEQWLKHTPNLTIFTIKAVNCVNMINADRWQNLIESSLLHLRVFNFYFSLSYYSDSYNNVLNKLQQFQTNFWSKQHHWHTNYEHNERSASIHTMPYVWNEYRLLTSFNNYGNLNGFDKVTKLTLSQMTIKDNSPYYFNNVKSLELINENHFDTYPDEYMLQKEQIKFLNKIVNLSNIKYLKIPAPSYKLFSSSLLLEILKELPYVSSLEIDKDSLTLCVKDRELRKYLNTKITTLYLYNYSPYGDYIKSDEVDLLPETFSNLEQLHCNIGSSVGLSLIVKNFSKLSIINSTTISEEVHSWIQENASKLNVYINFYEIYNDDDDDEHLYDELDL